jgi:hypothetical protein
VILLKMFKKALSKAGKSVILLKML